MSFDDPADEPQTEAHPAVMSPRHRPFEPLEEPGLSLRVNSDARVAHRKNGRPCVSFQRDFDRLSGAELDRVGHEIGYDLLQPQGVPQALVRPPVADGDRRSRARQILLESPDGVADDVAQIDSLTLQLQTSGRQPREIEKLLDGLRQPRDLPLQNRELGGEPIRRGGEGRSESRAPEQRVEL